MSLHTLLAAAEYLEDKNTGSQDDSVRRVTATSPGDVARDLGARRVEATMAEERSAPSNVEGNLGAGISTHASSADTTTATATSPQQTFIARNQVPSSVDNKPNSSNEIQHSYQTEAARTSQDLTRPDSETKHVQGTPNMPMQATTMPNMDVILARARLAIASSTVAYGGMQESVPSKFTSPAQTNDIPVIAMPPSGAILQSQIATTQEPNNIQQTAAWHGPALKSGENRIVLAGNMTDPNFNTLLPSLIKTSEDEKVYAALQFKPVKRSMTLTHNQLEKNRRAHLKERFESLKSCIPRLGMRRSSNLTILKAALRHIQALKKKASEQEQLLGALQREKCDKLERLGKLKNELADTASAKAIDQYLESCLEKDFAQEETSSVASMPASGMLDDDQQSTSTASEAEEEEMKASLSFLPRAPNLTRDIVVYPPPSTPNRHPRRRIVPTAAQPQTTTGSNDLAPQENARRPEPKKTAAGPQRSPMKLYHTPSGRSATPSPPSNCYSFFPRFHIGSGGSPPLHSSKEALLPQKPVESMVFAGQRSAGRKLDNGSVLNPVYKVLSSYAISSNAEQPRVADGSAGQPHVLAPVSAPTADVKPSGEGERGGEGRRANPVPVRAGVLLEPDGRVSLPSFSGYQVKVKYVNPSIAVNASTAPSQAHIPMKKRYHDVSAFSAPAKAPRSFMTSVSNSSPKLTSLYVGASATVLGLESSETGISTSDTESDRDSPMYADQSRVNPKVRHWMKNAAGREWTEYRSKDGGKKKPVIQVHPYEPAKTSGASHVARTTDNRPKATFSLWDRKHHAITMTTATNWRGKQKQLLASRNKTSVVSSVAAATAALSAPTSVTQVSYTTLQKASKPAIPSTLVVGQSAVASPLAVAVESRDSKLAVAATIPQPPQRNQQQPSHVATTSVPEPLLVDANGLLRATPGVQALPVTVAGNQVAYQIVQAPLVAPASGPGAHVVPASAQGHPTVGYVVNTPVESKDGATERSAVLAAPANMPIVVPVGYVMYPTGGIGVPVGQTGVHLAGAVHAQPNAVVTQAAPQGHVSLQTLHSSATRRPPSPPQSTDRSRKRVGSADSASSSTVSVDSQEGERRDPAKRPRVTPSRDQGAANHVLHGVAAEKTNAQAAQTQFLVPGSGGFVMANSGSAIPINLLGYPLQTYPAGGAGGIQTVQMASLPGNQGGLGQILSLPQGIVAMTTSVGAQQPLTSPVTLQVMQAATQAKDKSAS